mgnify:CR=1 FL=1
MNTAAAVAGVSETSSARSSVLVRFDARADAGGAESFATVTPDGAVMTRIRPSSERRGRRGHAVAALGVERRIERHDHRVLTALAELRTLHAVGEDLFGQPQVRHDRKPDVNEVAAARG